MKFRHLHKKLALVVSTPNNVTFYVSTCNYIQRSVGAPFISVALPEDRGLKMQNTRLSKTLLAFLLLFSTTTAQAWMTLPRWRAATEPELRKIIPARAPVIKENIETEFRTASGVTNGRGKFIAGVVMITAGYSAEGKYSHFFITQAALKIDNMVLQPGEYVFGYQRIDNETIRLSFFRASSGEAVGDVSAHVNRKSSLVRSLLITPPVSNKGSIQIGRFLFDYRITE